MNEKILSLDHYGRGIVKKDGLPIFVMNALPDEIGKIDIVTRKKHYLEAVFHDIKKTSPHRVCPVCPYYPKCGGCQTMHMDSTLQRSFKENKVKEVLFKFAHIESSLVKPIVYGELLGYRNKVVLHIEEDRMGFYHEKTHTLLPITTCFLVHPAIRDVMKRLQEWIHEHKGLTKALIRYSEASDSVLVALEGSADISLFTRFFREMPIASFSLNHNLLWGESVIEEILLGCRFVISEDSFFQVNREMTEKLYQYLIDCVKQCQANTVFDLYCGTGTIGLLVSPYVDQVYGIEVIESAYHDALVNKEQNGISNVTFLLGKVKDQLSLLPKDVDLIIVDPPRRGLDTETTIYLKRSSTKYILYVSCDVVTLTRDLLSLESEYEVCSVMPFDLFPNTYHVECVCVLKRR